MMKECKELLGCITTVVFLASTLWFIVYMSGGIINASGTIVSPNDPMTAIAMYVTIISLIIIFWVIIILCDFRTRNTSERTPLV